MNPTTCDLSDACDLLRIPAGRTGAIVPVWRSALGLREDRIVTLAPRAGAPCEG
jgi:hypothetical protein